MKKVLAMSLCLSVFGVCNAGATLSRGCDQAVYTGTCPLTVRSADLASRETQGKNLLAHGENDPWGWDVDQLQKLRIRGMLRAFGLNEAEQAQVLVDLQAPPTKEELAELKAHQ